MNRADSFAPRYYGGDPLARAASHNAAAPKRPPLVEYPGRLQEEEELGELRYLPVERSGQNRKRRMSRGLLIYLISLGSMVLGLTTLYLVREERVASANAICTQLERETASLRVSYEAKRTQFECSTDIAAVREIAAGKLNMGYATEDQIRFVSYQDPGTTAKAQLLAAAPAGTSQEENQADGAMNMILPETSPADIVQGAQGFSEEGGLVIPVETAEGAEPEDDILPQGQEAEGAGDTPLLGEEISPNTY